MKASFTTFLCFLLALRLYSQDNVAIDSISALFNKQLSSYPMEKIYACTDKPCYLAGEDIYFRIYLVDALSLIPDTSSRYVYAELINPWEELVSRVKIRPVEGAYHGYFNLPEDLADGSYQIRFYTRYMEHRGDDYFFKRKIDIGDPLSALYLTQSQYRLSENRKKIEAEFGFYDAMDHSRILPGKIRVRREKGGKTDELKLDRDSLLRYTFDANMKNNVIYMEYDYDGKFHKAFMPVTTGTDDYDLGFYPEGGHFISGARNKLAFKAVNRSGFGENVSGFILNERGDTIHNIQSLHRGMGVFDFLPQKGEKYNFLCQNEAGLQKTFAFPDASEDAISININTIREGVAVSILHSPELKLPEDMYLIIHYRGFLLSVIRWNHSQKYVLLKKGDLPSGINQVLLVDSDLNPLSERLIFSVNNSYFPQSILATDRPAYGKRQAINSKFSLLDSDGQPLEGDFAVTVTDDRDVVPDSTVNILSTLLLTSELRGYIEDPTFYFNANHNMRSYFLDILMMTQGWRVYDIPQTLKGNIQRPKGYLELGPAITGSAKGGLLMTSTAKGIPVKIVSYGGAYFDETITDDNGRFIFNIPEMPDSTRFVMQANTRKGGSRIELLTDSASYPFPRFNIPLKAQDNNRFLNYMKKADQAFIQEFGMHTIYLDEVVVRAKRREKKGKSSFSSPFNTIVSSSEFEKQHPHTIFDILRTMSGVSVTGQDVSIRGAGAPLVIIDDIPNESDILSNILVEDVDEIEIVKDAQAAIFGTKGANGVIMITTKRGFDQTKVRTPSFNIKAVMPLGYQAPKAFYSPKYDSPEAVENSKPDLRTTIYWNPDVKIKAGNAGFTFYSADTDSDYSIVIEGITKTGRPFYTKKRISAGQ